MTITIKTLEKKKLIAFDEPAKAIHKVEEVVVKYLLKLKKNNFVLSRIHKILINLPVGVHSLQNCGRLFF